jgi:hypothetical protein
VRTECGGTIAVSENGMAAYDWHSMLLNKTQLRYTLLEFDALPDSLGDVSQQQQHLPCCHAPD